MKYLNVHKLDLDLPSTVNKEIQIIFSPWKKIMDF